MYRNQQPEIFHCYEAVSWILQEKTWEINDFLWFRKMMKYTCIKNLASATKWVGNTFCELSIGVLEAETLDLSLLQGVFLGITRTKTGKSMISMFAQDEEIYMYEQKLA